MRSTPLVPARLFLGRSAVPQPFRDKRDGRADGRLADGRKRLPARYPLQRISNRYRNHAIGLSAL
jgi:hypothetical protein